MEGRALACGNAFILKPSERDPSVPVRLAELFTQAGLPDGVFQVINGDKVAVDALLTHPDVKALGFVGSSDIAQYIYSTAAANGKRSQCFGGAKNHMIIMPDANLDQVVDALIGAGYGSAGERCMAISVAVPVGSRPPSGCAPSSSTASPRCGWAQPRTRRPTTDRFVTGAALARGRSYIDKGVEEGADLVVDGRERGSDEQQFGDHDLSGGYFIGPTLFDHVTKDMVIYTDEIFGPVLRSSGPPTTRKPLAWHRITSTATVSRSSPRTATRPATSPPVLRWAWWVSTCPSWFPWRTYTFGGWKRSGFGDLNQHGPASIEFYTKTKTVTTRWPSGIKDGAEFVIPTMD